MSTNAEALDGEGAKLERSLRGLAEKYFGLSDADVIDLCAAPRNALVSGEWVNDWAGKLEDEEKVPPGLHIVVKSDLIASGSANEVVIFFEDDNVMSLYVKLVDFRPKSGLGGPFVQRIAKAASALKFRRLQLLGAGGRLWPARGDGTRWQGFKAWPRYGFDMMLTGTPLKDDRWDIVRQFPHIPAELAGCETVQDVVYLADGVQYWGLCGDGDYMEFDLAPDSVSWNCLNAWSMEGLSMKKVVSSSPDWGQQSAKFSGAAEFIVKVPAAMTPPVAAPKRKAMQLMPLRQRNWDDSVRSVQTNINRRGAEIDLD